MHTDIGIRPLFGSVVTNIQGRMSALATKMRRWISSLVKRGKKGIVADLSANGIHKMISPIAVLAGAAAFGFWWSSISAGLFACFALFFLAGIYKALQQIVTTLRWERDRIIAENSIQNASGTIERSERNLEIGTRAIEHLRPWVRGETSLTEDRCSDRGSEAVAEPAAGRAVSDRVSGRALERALQAEMSDHLVEISVGETSIP